MLGALLAFGCYAAFMLTVTIGIERAARRDARMIEDRDFNRMPTFGRRREDR